MSAPNPPQQPGQPAYHQGMSHELLDLSFNREGFMKHTEGWMDTFSDMGGEPGRLGMESMGFSFIRLLRAENDECMDEKDRWVFNGDESLYWTADYDWNFTGVVLSNAGMNLLYVHPYFDALSLDTTHAQVADYMEQTFVPKLGEAFEQLFALKPEDFFAHREYIWL